MQPGEYATAIEGVSFFRRKELEPVATVWEYQTTERFSEASARSVFSELPDGLEVCCVDADLEPNGEQAFNFIRRIGAALVLRKGTHGFMSGLEQVELPRAAELLMASPLVKKPDSRFESFRVTKQK